MRGRVEEEQLQSNGEVAHLRFYSVSGPTFFFILTPSAWRSGAAQLLYGARKALCVHLARGKRLTVAYKWLNREPEREKGRAPLSGRSLHNTENHTENKNRRRGCGDAGAWVTDAYFKLFCSFRTSESVFFFQQYIHKIKTFTFFTRNNAVKVSRSLPPTHLNSICTKHSGVDSAHILFFAAWRSRGWSHPATLGSFGSASTRLCLLCLLK